MKIKLSKTKTLVIKFSCYIEKEEDDREIFPIVAVTLMDLSSEQTRVYHAFYDLLEDRGVSALYFEIMGSERWLVKYYGNVNMYILNAVANGKYTVLVEEIPAWALVDNPGLWYEVFTDWDIKLFNLLRV